MTSIAPAVNIVSSQEEDSKSDRLYARMKSDPVVAEGGVHDTEDVPNQTSLQDSKRLGFAKSFQRLSLNPEIQNNPLIINEKMKSTFVDFCTVVEKGVNDSLIARFNLIHGITPNRNSVGSMNLSQLRSTEALPSDEPNNSRTCHPSQGSKPLQNDTADRRSSSLAADGQRLLKKTGSMNALPTATGAPHSRNASRTRTEVIGLKHTRSMHRAESGRVRSAGRSAACYLQKEESYKLRLTVEARIRCPVVEPEMPPMPSGLATAPLVSSGRCNGARGGEEEAAESTVDGLRKQFKSLGGGLNLVDRQPTIGDQARDIRNAIKAIIDDMPEPIPGTPIVIMFNAIVYHENTEGSDQEYALAFSWKSETNTPAGAMIKELKQQRMEQAYREQGVELDSVKAAAAEAAALAQQHTLVGKIKGLFKTGSRSNIKRSSSNLAE